MADFMAVPETERRVPVQRTPRLGKRAGTVAWWEHVKAWERYHCYYGGYESPNAVRIAERGGFDYQELVDFLGYEPETWEPNP